MALLPTIAAILLGGWLGMRWGGSPDNVLAWRPTAWPLALVGITLTILNDVIGPGGSLGVILRLLALGLIAAFAFLNIRTGGMILVFAGFAWNFLITLFFWGMPVSASALVSSGIADNPQEVDALTLTAGRKVAEGATAYLGDFIPLPWGQVISIGDILWLTGLVLVTSSVLRRYEVRSSRVSPAAYNRALSALNRGPAPRKGPGLHPSRLSDRSSRDSRPPPG